MLNVPENIYVHIEPKGIVRDCNDMRTRYFNTEYLLATPKNLAADKLYEALYHLVDMIEKNYKTNRSPVVLNAISISKAALKSAEHE